ncbi:MAG: type II CRISPR RNA-guided endonuclease Cas9 [Clostridia bacterium]|nr:type II CRISPR RNA-guided endonuclease Cas9 [Clostridia bacterium]
MNDYYVGLDIGTNSVGWCATDTAYNVLRKRGQDMMGSYLFDEAVTAGERRTFRITRRRVARRHQRIMLLQGLFADEMEKKDPLFFVRLNNSFYAAEDKDERLTGHDSVFADTGYRDEDYFEQYPTIYHLKSAFVHGEKIDDVRLLYLAIHHTLKNRGHFLFEGAGFDCQDLGAILKTIGSVNACLREKDLPTLDNPDIGSVIAVLTDSRLWKLEKLDRLCTIYGVSKTSKDINSVAMVNLLKAVTGCTFRLSNLFITDESPDEFNNVTFNSAEFEERVLPDVEEHCGEDEVYILRQLKAIYNWTVLSNMMGGYRYISDAKIAMYNKHRADLLALKEYVKETDPSKYGYVFKRQMSGKVTSVNNYAAYVGKDGYKKFTRCTKEQFYKFLRDDLNVDDPVILKDMANGTFMPLLRSVDNITLPYQVHAAELKVILDNASKTFGFLNGMQDGMTVKDKILKLMSFHVPYYVGPLKGDASCAVFNEGRGDERITPWNFDEAVDKSASEDKFIKMRIGKCTYLPDQDVLPKNSILFKEFCFLNELNCLRLNGEKNEAVRKFIYEYAKTHRKVELDACRKLMIKSGIIPKETKLSDFSGLYKDFRTSMSSYVDFACIGKKRERYPDMCENIILWSTVLSDKSGVEARIREHNSKILSNSEIIKLSRLEYSGWGRLSKEFISGIRSGKCHGEDKTPLSIIEAMRLKPEYFTTLYYMEGFENAVTMRNNALGEEPVSYKKLAEKLSYKSTAEKRAVWRAIVLVKEIAGIFGSMPKKVFIEIGKKPDGCCKPGERPLTRKEKLLALYKELRNSKAAAGMGCDFFDEILACPNDDFTSDRLYLYYLQGGRCMYSGNRLSLEDLSNRNICDEDHIYPKSKLYDDSLDNKVLVLKTSNMHKADNYPLEKGIQKSMLPYWEKLLKHGMITPAKFFRLTRKTPLTKDDIQAFISRQMSFTNSSSRIAAEFIRKMFPDTEVIDVRSSTTNTLRMVCKITKVREMNNLHHAVDAYLNIVAGNVVNTRFWNWVNYPTMSTEEAIDIKKIFYGTVKGAWCPEDRERIAAIAARNTGTVVRMTESAHGGFYNQQMVSGKPGSKFHPENLIPLKSSGPLDNTKQYGGYSMVTNGSFMVVRSKDKLNRDMITIEGYPSYYMKRYGTGKETEEHYCTSCLGLVHPEILLDNIKRNTLMYRDGYYVYLRGSSPSGPLRCCNANELFLDSKYIPVLKKVCTYIAASKAEDKKGRPVPVTAEETLFLYDGLAEKFKQPCYAAMWERNDYAYKVASKRSIFQKLSLPEQCYVLYELLRLLQCKPGNEADLKLIGGNLSTKILMGRIITKSHAKIIYQSPTGYYRKVIKIDDLL